MVTTNYLEHDALTRSASSGQLYHPEPHDDPNPEDLALLWLDLGGGD